MIFTFIDCLNVILNWGSKNSVASVVRIFSVAVCGNKNIVIIFPIKRKQLLKMLAKLKKRVLKI